MTTPTDKTLVERIDTVMLRLNIANELDAWRIMQTVLADVRELQDNLMFAKNLLRSPLAHPQFVAQSLERFDAILQKTGADKS